MSQETVQKISTDKDIAQIGAIHNGSRSFGPVKFTYSVDTNTETATVAASMLGVSLGSNTLTVEKPQAEFGGNISLYNVNATIAINFQEKKLYGFVDVNMMGKTIYHGNVTLLDW